MPEGDFFQKNQDLSRTSPCGPLTPYKIPEKPNGSIPRKLPERRTKIRTNRRTDRRMEGQTLIHRTLPAMTGCPKKKKNISIKAILVGLDILIAKGTVRVALQISKISFKIIFIKNN